MNDPRREVSLKFEKKNDVNESEIDENENGPVDYFNLLSMLCGMVGLMMKMKIGSWMALFFAVASICRFGKSDMKQIMVSLMFSVMGLVMNYSNAAKAAQAEQAAEML